MGLKKLFGLGGQSGEEPPPKASNEPNLLPKDAEWREPQGKDLFEAEAVQTPQTSVTETKETSLPKLKSRITFTSKEEQFNDAEFSLPAVQIGNYTLCNTGRCVALFDEHGERDTSISVDLIVRDTTCDFYAEVWNGYVIFLDDTLDKYVALQVAGEDGVIRPPRNWIRCHSNETSQSVKLTDHIRELSRKLKREKTKLEGGFQVTVTDQGIAIQHETQPALRDGDNLPDIGDNYCIDPTNRSVVYYCTTVVPKAIFRIDTSSGKPPWHPEPRPFPKGESPKYLRNLKIHPSGEFFVYQLEFGCGTHIRRVDTMEEIPCAELNGTDNMMMGEDGHFFCISGGVITRLETNLDAIAQAIVHEQRTKGLQGLSAKTFLQKVKAPTTRNQPAEPSRGLQRLLPQKKKFAQEFGEEIAKAQSFEDIRNLRDALDEFRAVLGRQAFKPEEVAFVTDDIATAIGKRNQKLADAHVTALLQEIQTEFGGKQLSLPLIIGLKEKLDIDRSTEQVLSPGLKKKVENLREQVRTNEEKLFLLRGNKVVQEISEMVVAEGQKLESMTKPSQFEDWTDKELHAKQSWLSSLVPAGMNPPPLVLDRIILARGELQGLCDKYDEKFRAKLDKIRETASKFSDKTASFLKGEIGRLVDRLERKHFKSRKDAARFVDDNDARKALQLQIDKFVNDDQSQAEHLRFTLQSRLENFLDAVERRSKVTEGPDGKQMETFGNTLFPIYEGEVREYGERKTEFTFLPSKKALDEGIPGPELQGDAAARITTGDGHHLTMRLWEKKLGDLSTDATEDDMRVGLLSYKGQEIAPSYQSKAEFMALKKLYAQWRNNGALHKKFKSLRKGLKDCFTRREKLDKRSDVDTEWQVEYKKLFQEFADFCAENKVTLLERMEDIENAKDPEYENGKGFIPERRNTWVVAPEDDAILEQMAIKFKKQLDPDVQQGALLLKGHPGTGKDVLLRIFAERTRRPFFPFDCSNQTSEFDLSQDIALDERDGATVTVKEDSIVLRALETPGAILYFNEFNNMKEPVQIFLNGLLAEPRAVALKTSSGRIVKAHPSVLIAASMNPNYKGTNPLASSTRDRLDEIEVGYAPLRRSVDPNNSKPTDPFSASEALKIARIVKSLKDMTLAPNMERNEFVKAWDAYVNKIGESPKLSQEKKFDMDVILGLVQFAEKLRIQYLKGFEKGGSPSLPVKHPVTLRTLTSCGYLLGLMTDAEKVGKSADDVARILIKGCLLQHIDSAADKEKISTAMNGWTVEPRVL